MLYNKIKVPRGESTLSDFGEKLQALRKRQRLSQKALACLSGVSPSYLSRVERGQRKTPHPSVLKKISLPLGVSEYDMLTIAGYISKDKHEHYAEEDCVPKYWGSLLKDPTVNDALRQLNPLTQEEIKAIALYLKAIKLKREEDTINL